MIKKYKYLFIAILLLLLTSLTISRSNNTITVFNAPQLEYENFIERFIVQINESQNKNPVSRAVYESKGERYIYTALSEIETILGSYSYTDDTVPKEYINTHKQMVEFITTYSEGITLAREGMLLLDMNEFEEGLSRIAAADKLLVRTQEDFILKKGSLKD